MDSAPYLCEVVPEKALRQVTGFTGPLKDYTSGQWAMSGNCLMQDVTPSPLSLGWGRKDGEKVLERLHGGVFAQYNPTPLPAEMGTGSVLIHPRPPSTIDPNDVIAIFRCGDVRPWIHMSLPRVAPGRDPVKDLTDLMRIAQKRYGELHDCTPAPLGEADQ
ncbi:hypothetical protein [Spongiactinospora sp. 9N601]|uniref:hypothetical protein n=1 Tax=Spongiactinospora sp. 9N601 TaxID=3375149 RepID=UPI0037A6CB4D